MNKIAMRVQTMNPTHDYGWIGDLAGLLEWLTPRYRDWRDCGMTRCGCRTFTAFDAAGHFTNIRLTDNFHGLHA